MEKTKLIDLIERRQTIKQIAVELKLSQTAVRYWLRKYDLYTCRGPHGKLKDTSNPRKCKCGETDTIKFYGNKKNICARCHNQYNLKKGQDRRDKIISLLGGRCINCGFNRYNSALDIHHKDPKLKDPGFKYSRSWSLSRWEKELPNCILLCKNCHAIEHNRV